MNNDYQLRIQAINNIDKATSTVRKVEENNYPAAELSRNEAQTHQPVTVEVVTVT